MAANDDQSHSLASTRPASGSLNGNLASIPASPSSILSKKNNKQQIKRRKKKKKGSSNVNGHSESEKASNVEEDDEKEKDEFDKSAPDVEIEYVTQTPELGDDNMKEFSKIFEYFQILSNKPEVEESVETTEKVSISLSTKPDIDPSLDSDPDSDDEDKKDGSISKKKLRKLNRLSVAELKQLVKKPEVVEWVDVTAADPKLLVTLKSYRNTVPVPQHWSQKRKYLQGKRGIEKPPWDLPEFIKDTGIMEMREAVKEKEDAAKLKQKTRERHQPKMGKLDIDYQKLHDAFFRFQTKPKLSIHGELYYEGKEFEPKLKEKKPGVLSDELKQALGMPPLAPPPWLINMQRYGPPPSYKQLKIAGLNAPIPEGAMWGYHPGGWGRPPVDEFGRPIYGDVFGMSLETIAGVQNNASLVAPVEKKLWGELEEEESEEEEEEESEEEEEREGEDSDLAGGLVTPSGMASVASTVPGGLETPDFIELRKGVRLSAAETEDDGVPKQFYQVLPEVSKNISGFMGSSHGYDLSARKRKPVGEGVEVALDPSELESLDEDTLRQKFEQGRTTAAGLPEGIGNEDLSDMVAEHAAGQAKKRAKKSDENKTSKGKGKEFKF